MEWIFWVLGYITVGFFAGVLRIKLHPEGPFAVGDGELVGIVFFWPFVVLIQLVAVVPVAIVRGIASLIRRVAETLSR